MRFVGDGRSGLSSTLLHPRLVRPKGGRRGRRRGERSKLARRWFLGAARRNGFFVLYVSSPDSSQPLTHQHPYVYLLLPLFFFTFITRRESVFAGTPRDSRGTRAVFSLSYFCHQHRYPDIIAVHTLLPAPGLPASFLADSGEKVSSAYLVRRSVLLKAYSTFSEASY